jgi:hypothetical protein
MRTRRYHRRDRKTRKSVPWKGWGKIEPKGRERTEMYRRCGKRCFLGTKTKRDKQHPNFPICAKNTCKVSDKGLWAAYIRAKQWGKPRKDYKSKGKWVTWHMKDGKTKKVWYKGSRPEFKQSYYTRISRKAKKMLERRGYYVGK